jgi:hypothetical protein
MNVLLVDTLWEEGHDLQKLAGVGSEFLEHRRGEGKFDRCRETPGVFWVEYRRAPSCPFRDQSVRAPLVLLSDSGK